MADEERQKVSTSTKDTTRLPTTAGGSLRWTKIQRLVILHVVGVLLLLFVIRDAVVSKSRVCSWFSSLFDRPRFPFPGRRMTTKQREDLFLSIPSPESALEHSRQYGTHPHLAGSLEDELDAKSVLHFFHDQFGIPIPEQLPIYKAGSESSRNATLHLTTPEALTRPTAWIDTYYPVLNTGLDQALQILDVNGNALWTADLKEDGDPRDPEAHKYKSAIPPWHGLSANGDVTGRLVYANYGSHEDYAELIAQGANLTGKVVIARYGQIFRGLKIKGAEELGAVGVLIYSDPRDDGYVTVANDYPPYPAGPARNPSSIQRGSAQFLSIYPGDPTTPGYPAYEDAERTEGVNIPKIPSLPISWQNAQKLLEEIRAIYTSTPDGKKILSGRASKNIIRLANYVDTKVTPIWNAMAAIPGHIKSEVIIIGCHRDAWVMGAADPTSGTVSLLEIVRGFGVLLRKGWKPLRTVIIASWDAEEYGLIGSTEWGEDFAKWISDHVVAYLNVDNSVSGSQFKVFGTPSLAHVIRQSSEDVPHPTKAGKTLWDAIDDEGPLKGFLEDHNDIIDEEILKMHDKHQEEMRTSETKVRPLGSGSDYTVFLQRLGVASLDSGFKPTLSDPVYHYHSVYDSQAWQERYADPGFHRHVAVARYLGLVGLRLIDAIILPLNTTQYALELDNYLAKVEGLLPLLEDKGTDISFSSLRAAIRELQEASFKLDDEKAAAEKDLRRILRIIHFPGRQFPRAIKRRSGVFRIVADKIKQVFGVPPPSDSELHVLSLRHAESWEEYLEFAANVDEKSLWYEKTLTSLPFPISKFIRAAKRVVAANRKLIAFERGFISEGGIKDREWYRHLGVAPGKWLGYGATTFPALTEAITYDKNVTLIRHEALRLETLIVRLAATITP